MIIADAVVNERFLYVEQWSTVISFKSVWESLNAISVSSDTTVMIYWIQRYQLLSEGFCHSWKISKMLMIILNSKLTLTDTNLSEIISMMEIGFSERTFHDESDIHVGSLLSSRTMGCYFWAGWPPQLAGKFFTSFDHRGVINPSYLINLIFSLWGYITW